MFIFPFPVVFSLSPPKTVALRKENAPHHALLVLSVALVDYSVRHSPNPVRELLTTLWDAKHTISPQKPSSQQSALPPSKKARSGTGKGASVFGLLLPKPRIHSQCRFLATKTTLFQPYFLKQPEPLATPLLYSKMVRFG